MRHLTQNAIKAYLTVLGVPDSITNNDFVLYDNMYQKNKKSFGIYKYPDSISGVVHLFFYHRKDSVVEYHYHTVGFRNPYMELCRILDKL